MAPIIAYLLWKNKLIETQFEIDESPKRTQKLVRMYSHRNDVDIAVQSYHLPSVPYIAT
jgi:hypothetical protein